jgi:U3 small nucleolar RNA-associated protein 25
MGIQVNPDHGKGSGPSKGVYVRLYSDFYISDIILASPIGLKLTLDQTSSSHEDIIMDSDFLSSIEQVLIHQADVLYMQNWEHVDYIFRHINQMPKHDHDTDYSRVRSYFLDGQSHLHRQVMMLSAVNHPELSAFYREFGQCQQGQVRVLKQWRTSLTNDIYIPIKQVFQSISFRHHQQRYSHRHNKKLLQQWKNPIEVIEEQRFDYFTEHVIENILKYKQSRTLIIVPSYLDFVKIRNYLLEKEVTSILFLIPLIYSGYSSFISIYIVLI